VATIALLWVAQIALAAMFLAAGGSKLAGAPAMVDLFAAIGFGQWFRYVTGVVEIIAAAALLIPSAASLGAVLLVATMLGAVIANLSRGRPPTVPLVLGSSQRRWHGLVAISSRACSLARERASDLSTRRFIDDPPRACQRKGRIFK
jgi:hypothetical protein